MSLHPSPAPRGAPTRERPALTLVHEPDSVRMLLTGPPARGSARAPLVVDDAVERALSEAREHRAHHVIASVEASGPLCGPLLEAARSHVGVDVRQVRTRRAGSSVMVDLELLLPETPLAGGSGERAQSPSRRTPA